MLGRVFDCLAIVCLFAAASHAQDAGVTRQRRPLFEAFKSLCVNTDAEPDAIVKAVKAVGGTPAGPGLIERSSRWNVAVDGDGLTVSIMTMDARVGASTRQTSCTVESQKNEDDSIAAIVEWVGVPPIRDPKRDTNAITKFLFIQQLGGHNPLPTDPVEFNSAVRLGRYWGLEVFRTDVTATVVLVHFIGATSPSQPAPNSGLMH